MEKNLVTVFDVLLQNIIIQNYYLLLQSYAKVKCKLEFNEATPCKQNQCRLEMKWIVVLFKSNLIDLGALSF